MELPVCDIRIFSLHALTSEYSANQMFTYCDAIRSFLQSLNVAGSANKLVANTLIKKFWIKQTETPAVTSSKSINTSRLLNQSLIVPVAAMLKALASLGFNVASEL